jgi:hypothetical protein
MKAFAIRNTHVKYESPSTYQSKLMSKVKVLEKVKLQGQRYEMKGVAIRNTHVKHESSSIYQSQVISKVKVC